MSSDPSITALVYGDSSAADEALRDLAIEMTGRGLRLAGLVQLKPGAAGALSLRHGSGGDRQR